MTIEQKLDKLADLQVKIDSFEVSRNEQREFLDNEKKKLLDSIYTPEIRKQVEEIEAEFAPKYEKITSTEEEELLKGEKTLLEAEIAEEVIAVGKSVKGSRINAVYTKPRITWETDKMEGYAVDHPEIAQFRKVGKPSVSFRKI